MLKFPSFDFGSQKKFTPEELQGFKDTADVNDAKVRARQTLQDYQNAIEQAQSVFSQSAQMQTPERQQVGKGEGLALILGDALRNVVSTAPRKYRQPQTPGIQVAQGLKDQEYARQLQDAQIGYQNDQQRILAGQRAAEVGLRKFELGYEGAKEDVAAETAEARFNRQQGHVETQAIINNAYQERGIKLDEDRIRIQGEQWQKDFDRLSETEASRLQREQAGYEAQGMSPADARKMAFADKMLSVRSAELKDLELKRTKELYDALPVSAEVKHTLWQREAEVELHDARIREINSQIASHNRANQPTPDDLRPKMLVEYQGKIESYRKQLGEIRQKKALYEPKEKEWKAFDKLEGEIQQKIVANKRLVNNNVAPGFYPEVKD